MSDSPNRSFEKIALSDLHRLAQLAIQDLNGLFERKAHSAKHRDRLMVLCLCQGAAQHFVHGDRGVQDFDVWAFFSAGSEGAFPARRRGKVDFGLSRFGSNPEDGPSFKGRRVDIIGRSIDHRPSETPEAAVRRYLKSRKTESAKLLAERPVIALTPKEKAGHVIWPIAHGESRSAWS